MELLGGDSFAERMKGKRQSNGRERVRRSRTRAPGGRALVAGIGASAGGLRPLEEFVGALPADSGIAFVVLQHQHAGQPTVLAELLSRHAKAEVVKVEDGTPVVPGRVYVAPPGCEISLDGDALHVSPGLPHPPLPIDRFFRSLARSLGDRAIGVVLSGTGHDGTIGTADIKADGGIVAVQEPATAQHQGMPRSVLAAHAVDLVLPPKDIARELVRLAQRQRPAAASEETVAQTFQYVLALLQTRTGQDFSTYRRPMLRRRIERRMDLCDIDTLETYRTFLRDTPAEVDALYRELLVSVTTFFRDPQAFAALGAGLAGMVRGIDEARTLRGWVPGCATGEEAYSLAILLREVLDQADKPWPVQIFATDIDHDALAFARAGRFPAGIAVDLSPERLERFFTPDGSGYRVAKELRDMIVFAAQDVVRDPPFRKLDVISCRNLLIYLEPEVKRRVIALFGHALHPRGLLLLGLSESPTTHDETLEAVDGKLRLFRRRETSTLSLADLAYPGRRRSRAGFGDTADSEASNRLLLSLLAPPGVAVSLRGEIGHIRDVGDQGLQPARGILTGNILDVASADLRRELTGAMRRAARQKAPVVRHGVKVTSSGSFHSAKLEARRLSDSKYARGMLLMSLALEPDAEAGSTSERASTTTRVEELEAELRRTRSELDGTVEALRATNDELAQANEQMQSSNEELQSANQQLETSREELQSLNVELHSVNTELFERNQELSLANDDMYNLLDATGIAVVFIDNELVIRRFSAGAQRLLGLIAADAGRPLGDLAVGDAGLVERTREVLTSGLRGKTDLQTADGRRRCVITPYRRSRSANAGVLIALVNVESPPVTNDSPERLRAQIMRAHAT